MNRASEPVSGIRPTIVWFFAASLFICGSAGRLQAQQRQANEYRWEAFAQFGGALYTDVSGSIQMRFSEPTPDIFALDERKSFAKTGRLFAGLRFSLTSANQVEVSYSYNPSRLTTTLTGGPVPGGRFIDPIRCHYVSFNYVRYLSASSRFRTFLTGGLGFVAFRGPLETEFTPAANFGLGLDVGLAKHLAFRFEQRAFVSGIPQRTFVSGSPTFDIKATTFNFVPSAGLVFRF